MFKYAMRRIRPEILTFLASLILWALLLSIVGSIIYGGDRTNHTGSVNSASPVPSASPTPNGCGEGSVPVLIPDPDHCRLVCEVPLLKGRMSAGGPEVYWRQGAMTCIPKCEGDWEPILQEWTDKPECGGVPIPNPSPSPVATKRGRVGRR